MFAVDRGLHGRPAFTDLFLMRAVIFVVIDPFVEIFFQHVDAVTDLLAKRHLIEILQDGLLEPLADTVGLR